jgi:hypothetical protein
MQKQKTTFRDSFQIIALVVNIMVVIGLASWNVGQEERLSKLEYEELAPRIVTYREVTLNYDFDYAFYSWVIRNNGRTAAENIVMTIYSHSEFPFEDCKLAVPFDNTQKRVSGEYILFEGITLPPQDAILATCSTKTRVLSAFMEKHKISPDKIPGLNCFQARAYDFDTLILLPNLEIIANNVEPSRTSCVEDATDILK